MGGQMCAEDGSGFGECDCGMDMDGGPMDAGRDASADAGAEDAASGDSGPDDAATGDGARDATTDAPVDVPLGCVPIDPSEPLVFVLERFRFPRAEDDEAIGFDVDGVNSGPGSVAADATCQQRAADFVSRVDDVDGVDNQYQSVVDTFAGPLDYPSCSPSKLECRFDEWVLSGQWLTLLEIDDVDHPSDDPSVTVRLYEATVAGGVDPEVVEERLVSGQAFDATLLAEATGRLRRGRLHASLPDLELPFPEAPLAPRDIATVELAATVCGWGIADGVLAGRTPLDDLIDQVVTSTDATEDVVRATVAPSADLEPSADDATVCESLSFAYGFTGVPASRSGG